MKTINVGGWPHVSVSCAEFANVMAVDCAVASSQSALPKLVFDLNGQGLSLASTDDTYRNAITCADYIHADGQSLVIASRIMHGRQGLPERIATTDFFHDAAKIASGKQLRFYLLGASEEVVQRARVRVQQMYPSLQIVGARSGYFDAADEADICLEIVKLGTDVLWVGLGKPKEQLFCVRNQQRLQGVAWLVTCGGLFDFLSARNSRAPRVMQQLGFEWLYRLALEPRRLFRRYLVTNAHAIVILLRNGRVARHAK